MASIHEYETAKGTRYRVSYRDENHHPTTKRGLTKKQAELFAAEVTVKKATGELIDAAAGRATIGMLGTEWLKNSAHLAESSVTAYESAWRIHVEPRWRDVAVKNVKPTEVQAWINELRSPKKAPKMTTPRKRGRPRSSKGLSASTVRRCFDILAGILDSAVADRRILRNPARGTKLPRRIKRPHIYLRHDQVEALAESARGDNALVVRILAYTGIRWGELAGLKVGDLDLLRRRADVNRTKTYEPRSVPLPAFLVEPLARQCEGKSRDDLLFPGRGGGRRKTPTVNERSWWDGVKSRAGVPAQMTIHDLRHTAASLAISAGANVKAVQRMLGHKSAAITLDTYADLFESDVDTVSDALDRQRSEVLRSTGS